MQLAGPLLGGGLMNGSRKPALGISEPDWDRFTPEQNVIQLAPVIGLEAAMSAVFADNWVFDAFEQAYLTSGEVWRSTHNPRENSQVLLIYFWIDHGHVCVGTRVLSQGHRH